MIFEPYEETVSTVFARKTMDSVIDFGVFCENGILRMFQDIEGVVESSNNVGCVTTDEEKVTFVFVTRSSLESIYQTMVLNIDRLARNVAEAATRITIVWNGRTNRRVKSEICSLKYIRNSSIKKRMEFRYTADWSAVLSQRIWVERWT